MAVYSKRQLNEQHEMINIVKALTALTILRLNQTYKTIKETTALIETINASVNRVFEIHPSDDPINLKQKRRYLPRKSLTQKTILVFIASNQEFYGDLIFDISKLFIDDFEKLATDAIVIGKIGRLICEKQKIRSEKIRFFELDDNRPDLRIMVQIIDILAGYDRVVIYHGKTESLLKQTATKSEVLAQLPFFIKAVRKYIYEPTADDVLDFLQTQTSTNSIRRHVYEAQYARLAAKRWSWTKQQMTRAKLLQELTRQFLQFKKSALQKQQQVAIFAHRQNILDNPNIKNTNIYGW